MDPIFYNRPGWKKTHYLILCRIVLSHLSTPRKIGNKNWKFLTFIDVFTDYSKRIKGKVCRSPIASPSLCLSTSYPHRSSVTLISLPPGGGSYLVPVLINGEVATLDCNIVKRDEGRSVVWPSKLPSSPVWVRSYLGLDEKKDSSR